MSDTVVPADEHDAPVPPPATAARPVPASQPPPTYDDAPLSQAAPASAAPNPAARLGVPAPGATTAPRPRRPRTDTAEPAQRNNVTADTADHADTDTDTDTDTSTNAKHLSKDTGPKESAKRNGASAPAPRRDDSVPGTAAPTASASAPSHSVAPSPSARSGSGGAGRGGPGQSWAHAAVFASYADAKMHPTRWQGYGFRIAPDVLAALKNRVNADRRTTGNSGLALGHYVDAALRHVPEDIEEQIAMARAFEDDRMWDLERTQPSTYRVGEQVLAFISSLNLALQEAGFGRRGTSVVSAVIERFLQAMDEEGPLQRPQRVRKAGPGTGT
ncbi:hypothetical protein [Streptantibioticus cattleyicolor]|uniref:hypothetical protein n=1 Tax=Streptantibioticus cattleyicolor TaxID=29303 RepID=UPI001319DAE2|nr:hypothetical protein [Streptantibioticus cattleyicolor]